MSKFTSFIDALKDDVGMLAKDELKDLIAGAKIDESDFVRLQAQNLERWAVMLADGDLTPAGFKKLVKKMEVLAELETIKLSVTAKASAQRLQAEITRLVVGQLFKLI
jgi:hypothetical protein